MGNPDDFAITAAIDLLRQDLREMHADLKRRVDGTTLMLNLLAGRVYKLQERVENVERS